RIPDKDEVASSILASPTMKLFRRALLALGVAVGMATALRLKAKGDVPPQQGGWRDITPNK
ncbi:MAG: hypothetical protein NWP73_06905, partial [Ilumatobacteraceae bacterium]|nr:hypothetical protein [Ilumatobacteraceae bacterium]